MNKLTSVEYQKPNSISDTIIFTATYKPDEKEIILYKNSEWAKDGYKVYIKVYFADDTKLEYESKVYEYLKFHSMNSNSIDDYFILSIAIHRNIKVDKDTKGVENIFWNAKTSINSEIERPQYNNTIYDIKRLETLNKLKNEPTKQVNCIITKTYTNIDSLTKIFEI